MQREATAAVFVGAGRPLEWRTVPVPEPVGAEVLVRVTACTLCGSDLHTFEGRRVVAVPTVLGHEIVGTIAAFGPAALRRDLVGQELVVGDRIAWSIVASCGACFLCRRDLPQKCERMVKYGHEAWRPGLELTGGLADHVMLAPGTALLRLPIDLPDEIVCPASCATSTVAAALEAAGPLAGRSVLVLGAGMLGLTACAMARSAGAAEVIGCDVRAGRRERAVVFGATRTTAPADLREIVNAVTAEHGVDAVLELSGSSDAFARGLELLRIGGTLVLVGAVFPIPAVAVEPERLVRRQLTVRGIHNYAPRHLLTAVRFLAERRFPFETLVSGWLPLRDTEEAFRRARGPVVFRVGVRP
jgi:alcohol dehydrogenase